MFKKILFLISLVSITTLSYAGGNGSISLEGDRIKIQVRMEKGESLGTLKLRGILEQAGFTNQDGFVKTEQSLLPLEIYNYLYEDGKFVFTIFIPSNAEKLFVSMSKKGFISFEGIAAERLFHVVKPFAQKRMINNLEQYKWSKRSYCDRTVKGEVKFRCWINN